ncbi:hypothetical protein [Solicola sp. PLA-1-18]|uniref:hypothetical protein n=1 Tax=Solicola sp. PLA-1-18 TaxID=3380532 RepID=UPI003B821752
MAADAEDVEHRVRRLISAGTVAHHSDDGLLRLCDLCDVAVADLDLAAATVSMMTDLGPTVVANSSSMLGMALADLEVACGEGPSFDATRDRRPVLASDLPFEGRRRWTEFAVGAVRLGCSATWTFPLGVGAARLGVLLMSFAAVQTMSPERARVALMFAEIATEIVLDIEGDRDDVVRDADVARMIDLRAEVYPAQGMVMVDLGTSATDALVRMRAHAFVHDLDLTVLATRIVDRTVRLEPR